MELSKLFNALAGLQLLLLLLPVGIVLAANSSAPASRNAGNEENLDSIELSLPSVDQPDAGAPGAELADAELLPKQGSLFDKDAVDVGALESMDCHLRNLDFCYAGLMGSSERLLPETDHQLEVRCDEMKAASSCVALFNKRCQTFKMFGAIGAISAAGEAQQQQQAELKEVELPPALESVLLDDEQSDGQQRTGNSSADRIKMADLSTICEPSQRSQRNNRLIRRRAFQIAKCINSRVPMLRPCIEDLKTAVQVFYEPARSLPMKPTCCAVSRFRACSIEALDNICGLTSFEQLERSLATGSGAGSMMSTLERVCRWDGSKRHQSEYCLEILPPSGMKTPQRRGAKASKLAKALDLFSFAPAA